MPSTASVWLRQLRVHQWAKNLLVVLPALAAHQAPVGSVAAQLLLAFASFSLLASAVYLVNDIEDVEHDRQHPTKRNRPLASGRVSVGQAAAVAALLAAVA